MLLIFLGVNYVPRISAETSGKENAVNAAIYAGSDYIERYPSANTNSARYAGSDWIERHPSVISKGHTFDATFIKWVTTTPPAPGVLANMVGVVDGDVGPGTYTGEVISMTPEGNITIIQALYHINGRKHAFTADLTIRQDESTGTATITGRVTEGWLKGASVTGEYNVLAVCPIDTPDNLYGTVCFQGALHVKVPK
jgi:hypothetical protein